MDQVTNSKGIKILEGNASDYQRIFVLGDVHADYEALKTMIDMINYSDNDLVVFLGDYIMKGKYERECLDLLLSMAEKPNVIVLMGNCDIYSDYKDEMIAELPVCVHLKDINVYMSHSGFDVKTGIDKCSLNNFLNCRTNFWDKYKDEAVWYIGHTSVKKLHREFETGADDGINKPYKLNNIWFMDTSKPYSESKPYTNKGFLSCIEIKSGKLYQVEREL